MTTITVYYADDIAARFTGVEPRYLAVYEHHVLRIGPDNDHAILNIIWEGLNHGSGHELPSLDGNGLRSMCVGDIVKLVDEAVGTDDEIAEHERLKAEGHLPEPCGDHCPRPRRVRSYRCASVGWEPIESWVMATEVMT